MFYMMLDMSKKVSAREFLHQFATLEKRMRPGESITVTRRGKPVGRFMKEPVKPKIAMPDFEKDASRAGFTMKDGDALLARMLRDEELS
jgi:antitoxin (DNA-binding transcriptional repressor) of toxin-antitoxin stability system